MVEFNFKSQIVTTREQSERLIALGLKKETADMAIEQDLDSTYESYYYSCCPPSKRGIPAWSLHRLLEMNLNSTDTRFEVRFNQLDVKDAYEILLAHIEWLIKEGYFNKEYLEE